MIENRHQKFKIEMILNDYNLFNPPKMQNRKRTFDLIHKITRQTNNFATYSNEYFRFMYLNSVL